MTTIRRGAAIVSLFAVWWLGLGPSVVSTAQGAAVDTCGQLVLAGSAWLGGQGVDVYSNGASTGSGEPCGGYYSYGYRWQCVELANRLYQVLGWGSVVTGGSGAAKDIFRDDPAQGRSKTPNGEIRTIYPGDLVVFDATEGNSYGHLAVVDRVAGNADGTWTVHIVEQNTQSGGRAALSWAGGALDRAGFAPVLGIVHDDQNTFIPAGAGLPAAAGDVSVIVVLDTSGSMSEDDGTGTIKLDGARRAFESFVNSAPVGVRIGLRAFPTLGTDCGAGDLIVPVGRIADPGALVADLYAHGNTPTGAALLAAADDLPPGGTGFMVLISDGLSNCEPPPCPIAEEIAARGIDLTINTIGFQISDEGAAELQCIANAGGGQYVDVTQSEELRDELEAALLPRLMIAASHPTQVVTTAAGLEPSPVVIEAEVKNTGLRPAAGVSARITFSTDRNPGLVDPIRLLGNLPAGATSAKLRWTFLPEPSLEPYTVNFEISASSPSTPNPVMRTGSISVGGSDPGSLLGLLEGGAPVAIIGDSYSAGEGAPNYDEGTDEDHLPGNRCHRGQTYGRAELPADQLNLLACSGAIAVDLIAPLEIDLPATPDACWSAEGLCPWTADDLEDTLPAQVEQLRDLEPDPEIVFLTIGGNDMGFGLVAAHCYVSDDGCQDDPMVRWCLRHPIEGCAATYEGNEGVLINNTGEEFVEMRLAALPGTLVDVLRVVDSVVNGEVEGESATQFVVLGYPSPLPGSHSVATGGCPDEFDDTELDWLGDVQADLNEAVSTAVDALRAEGRPFQYAASPALAFAGRTVCDAAPYAHGIELTNIVESLHPNSEGYSAMWDQLRQDLAVMYPIPRKVADPAAWAGFACDSAGLDGGDALVMGDESARVEVGGCYVVVSRGWEQRSIVDFYLMSDPRLVGRATADAEGNAVAMVWVPPSLEPGAHRLTAMGIDPSGAVATMAMEMEIHPEQRFPSWLPLACGGSGVALLLAGIILFAAPARKGARR